MKLLHIKRMIKDRIREKKKLLRRAREKEFFSLSLETRSIWNNSLRVYLQDPDTQGSRAIFQTAKRGERLSRLKSIEHKLLQGQQLACKRKEFYAINFETKKAIWGNSFIVYLEDGDPYASIEMYHEEMLNREIKREKSHEHGSMSEDGVVDWRLINGIWNGININTGEVVETVNTKKEFRQ